MVFCLAASAACSSSLSGSTDQPSVLATIHGTVEGSTSASLGTGPLAVAILWATAPTPGSSQVVSMGVPVKPSFPSSFSLDLTDLPPDSVMFDIANINCGAPPCDKPDAAPSHQRIALGGLVLYEDVNQNGELDLVPPGAPAFIDKIVSVAPYEIVYTEQPLPADQNYFPIPGTDGSVLNAGYNWVRSHRWDCEPGDVAFSSCKPSVFYRPIDTPIAFQMVPPEDQAAENIIMCSVIPGGQVGGSGSFIQESLADFVGPLPSSDDGELLCDSVTSFRYSENCTTTSPGVCLDFTTTCSQEFLVTLPPGMAQPADWPCVPQRSF
jgi:hypothetical protein